MACTVAPGGPRVGFVPVSPSRSECAVPRGARPPRDVLPAVRVAAGWPGAATVRGGGVPRVPALWLAAGFARFRCPACGTDRLVASSCKGRGFCPSCGPSTVLRAVPSKVEGRRAAHDSAHRAPGGPCVPARARAPVCLEPAAPRALFPRVGPRIVPRSHRRASARRDGVPPRACCKPRRCWAASRRGRGLEHDSAAWAMSVAMATGRKPPHLAATPASAGSTCTRCWRRARAGERRSSATVRARTAPPVPIRNGVP
jgi:hypothetical protein